MISPDAIFGRYFFFCSGVPYQTSGNVPMPVCAENATEKLACLEMFSATMAEDDLVHLEAAVLLGDIDRGEAELGGLFQQAASDGEVLRLDLVGGGHDLVDGEVRGGLGDLLLLVGEVFREEAVGGGGVGDEEAAAGDVLRVGWIGAVIVAMVLLLQKSLHLVQLRDYLIRLRSFPSNDELFAFPASYLVLVWTRPWSTLDPDPSLLLEAIRVVECEYLHLIKHRTPQLTVDLGNNDWPNIFNGRRRALP